MEDTELVKTTSLHNSLRPQAATESLGLVAIRAKTSNRLHWRLTRPLVGQVSRAGCFAMQCHKKILGLDLGPCAPGPHGPQTLGPKI